MPSKFMLSEDKEILEVNYDFQCSAEEIFSSVMKTVEIQKETLAWLLD